MVEVVAESVDCGASALEGPDFCLESMHTGRWRRTPTPTIASEGGLVPTFRGHARVHAVIERAILMLGFHRPFDLSADRGHTTRYG